MSRKVISGVPTVNVDSTSHVAVSISTIIIIKKIEIMIMMMIMIIVIIMLSLWHRQNESFSSFDECKTVPSGRLPSDQAS